MPTVRIRPARRKPQVAPFKLAISFGQPGLYEEGVELRMAAGRRSSSTLAIACLTPALDSSSSDQTLDASRSRSSAMAGVARPVFPGQLPALAPGTGAGRLRVRHRPRRRRPVRIRHAATRELAGAHVAGTARKELRRSAGNLQEYRAAESLDIPRHGTRPVVGRPGGRCLCRLAAFSVHLSAHRIRTAEAKCFRHDPACR